MTQENAQLLGWRSRILGPLAKWAAQGWLCHLGAIAEGVDLQIAAGWHGKQSATHQVAFVALPDGHTVVGLQFCRTDAHRTHASEVKGLHLNLHNDLLSGFRRQLVLRPLPRSRAGVHR